MHAFCPAQPAPPGTAPPGSPAPRIQPRFGSAGFTLVETLIVVLIIGILAALVVPRFTDAAGESRRGNTLTQLQTLRAAIQRYRLDHDQFPPVDKFWEHLTGVTTREGDLAKGGRFGPYITTAPINIYTGSDRVSPHPDTMSPDFGWIYCPGQTPVISAVGFDEATQTFSTTPM